MALLASFSPKVIFTWRLYPGSMRRCLMPGSCLHPLVLSLFMQALLVFLLFLKHPRAHPTVSGHLHLPISVPGKLSLPGCAQALLPPFSSPPRYQLLRAFLDSPPLLLPLACTTVSPPGLSVLQGRDGCSPPGGCAWLVQSGC